MAYLIFTTLTCILFVTASAKTHDNKATSGDFYLSPQQMTFYEALEECDFVGGRLASILTPLQDEQIKELLIEESPNSPLVAWTSGRYDFADNSWAWEAINRPLTFENWITVAPDPTEDSCVGIAAVTIVDLYGWLPATCGRNSSLSFRALCQF